LAPGALMKVLFFTRALTVGGSERQLAMLAAGLARRGHDVSIVMLYGGGALETLVRGSGVRLLPIGKSGRWHVMAPLAKLVRVFLAERPDVIYAFLPMQTTLAASLLPPRLRTRLVFGLRASAMELDRYGALHALIYKSEGWLSRRADLIIANARAVRVDAIARGLPADRIAVVPNGIDTTIMKPDAAAGRAQRRAWGIADRAFVIGMVARLDPMKDHANFLAAAAAFARDHADAWFVCVGDGPTLYREELKACARSLGLDERLVWAGEIDGVKAAYNAFDLATLSSRFGEGFPNVAAEAMACGTPMVATDVGDTKCVIGDCGEVVPPRAPQLLSAAWTRMRERLMEDRELRNRACARIAADYSIDKMVTKSEQVLAVLCAGRSASAIAKEFV
jgi:glycosyltransferase involved in cell wall biosynthesis